MCVRPQGLITSGAQGGWGEWQERLGSVRLHGFERPTQMGLSSSGARVVCFNLLLGNKPNTFDDLQEGGPPIKRGLYTQGETAKIVVDHARAICTGQASPTARGGTVPAGASAGGSPRRGGRCVNRWLTLAGWATVT